MKKIYLTVTVGPDYRLLPIFLRYYKDLGIENFLVILNTPDTLPVAILQEHNINPVKIWTDPFSEKLKQFHERDVVLRHCSDNDWVVYADLDEFQWYPTGIMHHIEYSEKVGVDFIEGKIIDRVSETGDLINLDNKKPLDEQFPLGGHITDKLLKAWDKKITVARGKLIVGGGHHIFLDSATYKTLPYKKNLNKHFEGNEVHHFKWDRGVLIRMNQYLQLSDKSLKYWRKEIVRFLGHYTVHQRINVHDEKLKFKSVRHQINI